MVKNHFGRTLLPSVIIPVGGLLVLATCYIGYFAVYMFIESAFFPNNPISVPAGVIRNSYAFVLFVLYLALLRTTISDLFKAIIFVGPMAMLIVATILALYLTPILAVTFTVAIAGCCVYLLYRYQKPWIYYYAAAISVVVAIAYAWPRA